MEGFGDDDGKNDSEGWLDGTIALGAGLGKFSFQQMRRAGPRRVHSVYVL
jgi:hypothetical protein